MLVSASTPQTSQLRAACPRGAGISTEQDDRWPRRTTQPAAPRSCRFGTREPGGRDTYSRGRQPGFNVAEQPPAGSDRAPPAQRSRTLRTGRGQPHPCGSTARSTVLSSATGF